MRTFSYSILIGATEKTTEFVYAELMIFIVRSQTSISYAEHLSNEEKEWESEGRPSLLYDNKNIHNECLEVRSFEGTTLRSYISDFGEREHIDPDIFDETRDGVPDEIFSKTLRFAGVENYYKFASATNTESLYKVGVYSNPDRYFAREIE